MGVCCTKATGTLQIGDKPENYKKLDTNVSTVQFRVPVEGAPLQNDVEAQVAVDKWMSKNQENRTWTYTGIYNLIEGDKFGRSEFEITRTTYPKTKFYVP